MPWTDVITVFLLAEAEYIERSYQTLAPPPGELGIYLPGLLGRLLTYAQAMFHSNALFAVEFHADLYNCFHCHA